MLDYTDPILETNVMGVDFTNPFGLSAGLDKNCEMPVVLDHAGFGFETVGSTTSRPCPGNAKPWFHRLPEYDSMMVHVGLANIGSDKVIERAEKAWTQATPDAAVRVDRPHQRRPVRRFGRRHRGLLHFNAPRRRPHRDGGGQRLLPEHARRRTVHRDIRRRSTVCLRRSTRSTARSPRWSRCR